MNKQNKLARKTIRARKAQKKRVNEQDKPKKGKRWLTRIFSLLGCLLLVSALVVPCFADETETQAESTLDREAVLSAFYELYHLDSTSPLYDILFGLPAVIFEEPLMLYQFSLAGEQDILNSQTQFLTYDYTAPINFYDEVVVCNTFDNSMYSLGNGHWSTSYTTSGDNRFLYLKYSSYRYDDGTSTETLRIRFRINKNTLQITEVTVELKDLYNLTLAADNVVIASVGSRMSVAPIDYGISNGFLRSEVSVAYDTFESILDKGYSGGYQNGFNAGHEQGTQEGYNSGYNNGFEVGRADGYHSGYIQGSSDAYYDGYDDGFEKGEESGYEYGYEQGYDFGETNGFAAGQKLGYENGYNAGLVSSDAYKAAYEQAVSEIDSGEWGKNFLGNAFAAPIEGLKQFNIVSWEMADGRTVNISIMSVVSAVIAVGLFFLFIKMFAGG